MAQTDPPDVKTSESQVAIFFTKNSGDKIVVAIASGHRQVSLLSSSGKDILLDSKVIICPQDK